MLLGICATLAFAAPARATLSSFDGYCDVRGTVTVDQPVTGTAANNVMHARGSGYCSGALNAEQVTGTRIEAVSDVPFYGSCYSNHSTAPGPSSLTFARDVADPTDDVVVRYTLGFTSDAVNGTTLSLKGERSGEGGGYSEVPAEDLPGYVAACEGSGLTQARFVSQAWTHSPLVSGDAGGGFPSPGGGSPTTTTRLLLGPTRGMRRARRGHPFRLRVRARGGRIHRVRIVVRDARGRRVGRSRRFSLGQRRKRVRVWVSRRLAAGRYRIVAAGHDATGRRVRAARSLRLRRVSR